MSADYRMSAAASTAVLSAGDAMYRALASMPCTCTREYLYTGKIVHQCRRCASMAAWEGLEFEPAYELVVEIELPS